MTNTCRIAVLVFFLVIASSACAKRSRSIVPIPEQRSASAQQSSATQRINLNTASAKELEALPGIGEGLAERIIEHRQKYGPFRQTEHLMMVRGISDARFREIRHLITVE